MAKLHPSFLATAVATCLFLSVTATDLSSFSCPDTCSTDTRSVQRDCIKFGIIGCFPRTCTTGSGRTGITCTMPTPVPTACPAICRFSVSETRMECRDLHFLRCAVEKCDIPDPDGGVPSLGYSCVDPTPTPTACTNQCRGTRSQASMECQKLVLLGCLVNRCITSATGRLSKLGFSCSTPSPTPTACPNVCMAFEIMARQQCREVTALGIDCRLDSCARGRGFICQAPTPAPTACPAMCSRLAGDVRRACQGLPDSLNCQVQRCDLGFGRRMYSCATPTPTPTACPGICYGSEELAFEECEGVKNLGLDCGLQRCASEEGSGISCGAPSINPGGTIVIDGENIGDDFKFNLNLAVEPGAGVSREDVYLLTDATGSMSAEIAEVRTRFSEIVAARRAASTDVQFGVGFYRDEAEGFDNGFNNLESITDDVAAVQAAISSIGATGGGDGPEANLVALYRLATNPAIGWRSGSRRLVVMLGDISGHEPSCIPGAPDLTREVVTNALNAEDITVVAVSFLPSMDLATFSFGCSPSRSTGTGQTTFIATGTGGRLISSSSSEFIPVLEETLGSLSLNIEADTSDCDGILTSTYDPSLPIEVEAGESVSICQVIELVPGICDAGATVNCEIRYTASGADTGTLLVRVSNVEGCT